MFLKEDDVILDIFSGTCSVGYSYKSSHKVCANDVEKYAYIISSALLSNRLNIDNIQIDNIEKLINKNSEGFLKILSKENKLILHKDYKEIIKLYNSFDTVWNTNDKNLIDKTKYQLFLRYYSTNYFGIKQAIEIDSIREFIDSVDDYCVKNFLFASLFYAMKECVFSKDGHMAQPLNIEKNLTRFFKVRKKSIKENFFLKLNEFSSPDYVDNKFDSKAYNYSFDELLLNKNIMKDINVIYADPPYTDMQYSRYYHLLNTCLDYDYPNITINNGVYTSGLYLDNRYQSKLSKKSTCLSEMKKLIDYSSTNNIMLIISFAYPLDAKTQKTDRYVMDVDDLIDYCKIKFGKRHVLVNTINYNHSNNRNSSRKKVNEYLIICKRKK